MSNDWGDDFLVWMKIYNFILLYLPLFFLTGTILSIVGLSKNNIGYIKIGAIIESIACVIYLIGFIRYMYTMIKNAYIERKNANKHH